jgi:hypothetical protein
MDNFKSFINESSLSRLWKHNDDHDCAALTAFRKVADCGAGTMYTKDDNRKRNKSLSMKLKVKGYGVTGLNCVYPEGGKESKEESFFVINLLDDPNFFKIIKVLGEEFDQDSVLIVPKGSIVNNREKAYLYGTNKCENSYPGYHKSAPFEEGKMGYKSPIYTSYVNGRPFMFEDVGNEIYGPGNGMGFWGLHIGAKKHWSEL